MNIKYIGENTAKLERGKVHKIENSSKTGCGAVYSLSLIHIFPKRFLRDAP